MGDVICLITGARKPVDGLSPAPIPAACVSSPVHLQCGACGFNGTVMYFVMSDDPFEAFEPLCDCPRPATLTA